MGLKGLCIGLVLGIIIGIVFFYLKIIVMKKLEEVGLVPLSKKESVEHDGGTNPPIKLPDIFNDGTIWCCVDIPPMERPN